jgi:hypothetical protein
LAAYSVVDFSYTFYQYCFYNVNKMCIKVDERYFVS